jgi:hypothetical protein
MARGQRGLQMNRERAGPGDFGFHQRTLEYDPEKCVAVFLATNAETRLRGDHAQTIA